jgi:hypothetical protein
MGNGASTKSSTDDEGGEAGEAGASGSLNSASMRAISDDAVKRGTVGYRGETVDGVKEGRGVFIYENGDMYKGFWAKNKKDGKGFYRCFISSILSPLI